MIVEKVGELFGLCGELDCQITRSKQDAAALMQPVLSDAFSG